MRNKPPQDANDLLVQLYALSHAQPMADFQNAALALLKSLVAFDAAIWGTATKRLMESLSATKESTYTDVR